MFIPIGVDHLLHKRPTVNYVIIGLNILAFIITPSVQHDMARHDNFIRSYGLLSDDPVWYQFLTHMFLHGGWMHLIGNMLFLWVFGNYVNQALGHRHYAIFYGVAGVLASLGHVMPIEGGIQIPLVGASGAIMGVCGAFLALHGRDTMRFLFVLIPLPRIPSVVAIGFFVYLDLRSVISPEMDGVSHGAHLAGFFSGFLYTMWMIAADFIPRTDYDLLSLLSPPKPAAAVAALPGATPVMPRTGGAVRIEPPGAGDATVRMDLPGSTPKRPPEPDAPPAVIPRWQPKTSDDLKADLQAALAAGDLDTLLFRYREFSRMFPGIPLEETVYQKVADTHYQRRNYEDAIAVCEKLLVTCPESPQAGRTAYILGLLHLQVRGDSVRALGFFDQAMRGSADTQIRAQAQQAMDQIRAATAAAAATTAAEPPETMTADLRSAMDAGDSTRFIGLFRRFQLQHPTRLLEEAVYQHAAELYYQNQQFADAIAACQKLLAQYPNTAKRAYLHYIVGLLHFTAMHSTYEARQHVQQCLAANPSEEIRAQALALQQRLDAAHLS